MDQKRCSRRDFVIGTAAITGAGILTSRPAGAQELEQPARVPACWHRASDVVIVGFGAAGAAAAIEAAAAGATVTILDTSATGGGDTAISGGYVYIGGGTSLQTAHGYSETPDQMYQLVRAVGGPGADPDIIRTWCERGPALFNWLSTRIGVVYDATSLVFAGMEQHAEFRALAPNATPIPHSHVEAGTEIFKAGKPLFEKLSAAALSSKGVTFKGQLKVVRLVQDPTTKRVLGVVAKAVDANGAFISGTPEQFFKAKKGVVVCTGCFSGDTSMMGRHNPALLNFTHFANKNADGSGIRMAQAAGGDSRMMKIFWALVFFAGDPTTPKGILVSPRGQRFVAEDGGYAWLAHYMISEEPVAYSVFDATALGAITPDATALAAETIGELVDLINARDNVGMSAELLEATVDGYNTLANADGTSGSDPAFRKDPSYVLPISAPPFYAVRHTAGEALGTTSGGLRVSTKAEVLGFNGDPIPGLFAAGTCANLTASERYT
jgi:3-oxo-5alpha-steroid 4-dehydrogenase